MFLYNLPWQHKQNIVLNSLPNYLLALKLTIDFKFIYWGLTINC